MKITFPQIFLGLNNQYKVPNNNLKSKKNNSQTNPINENKIFAYQDYNINFTGRTPENFYAQDFNRNNMPNSMKEYLDYDYETRQHIPPEQMMNEVFKYLEISDNFEDVKNVYPKEDLFSNLHENKSKNISSILYEIKTAKEMSNEPLLKDGSDNFGMYLLKKIYTEGKTIKEINKDFYTKDMNDTYKGIITKPITDKTTAGYGIKFPKQAFWNSFIATREEYKKFFVTLPKNTTNPAVHLPKTNKAEQTENNAPVERKRAPRKYNIPTYKKKQLTDDLKSSTLTNTDVEKKIRKRFASDDPEASFIVKYLSPIMTVAADRAHLSEDLKDFIDDEKHNGKNGDETVMFQRYWNRHPMMKTVYSHAITDTIDMFEDIYGNGGNIPINTDLKEVTEDSKNSKIIDNVNPEYLELLDYTQTIYPNREAKYAKHNEDQIKWEEHLNERYGNLEEVKDETEPEPLNEKDFEDNSVQPSKIEETDSEIDDDKLSIDTINKNFEERIKKEGIILPSPLLKEYCKFMNDNADLAFKIQVANLPKDCTVKDIQKIWRTDGSPDYIDDLNTRFFMEYEKEVQTTNCAIRELAITYDNQKLKNVNISADSNEINGKDKEFQKFISTHKQEFNTLYSKLLTPMTDRERNLVTLAFMSEIDKYENNKNVDPRTNAVILMFKDISKLNKNQRKKIKDFINEVIPDSTKTILNKKSNKNDKFNQFTFFMNGIIDECVFNQQYLPFLVNKETVEKYDTLMDSFDRDLIRRMEETLPPAGREFYNASNDKIKTGYFCETVQLPSLNKN